MIPCATFLQLRDSAPWETFRRIGLLRITNVVDVSKINHARREGFRVFDEPSRLNQAVYRGENSSGYTPPGIEGVADKPPNLLRQFWDIQYGGAANPRCGFSGRLVFSLEHVALDLTVNMLGVFYYLEHGLQAHGLHSMMAGGTHGLRATHYPMKPRPDDGIIFPEHRDFSVVTVFIGGCEPGLQVKINNEWRDVENPLGDIVIMAGTLLRFWTGGPKHPDSIRGVSHRVIWTGEERLSLSFFTEPKPETVLPNFDGTTSGEYISRLMKKVRGQI